MEDARMCAIAGLLDYSGKEKEEAKSLLREIHGLRNEKNV